MLVGLILLSVALGLACAGLGGCCWLLWHCLLYTSDAADE